MGKLYRKAFFQKGFLCFLFSYLFILLIDFSTLPYDSFLIFGHYVTLFPNMAFIRFCYDRMQSNEAISLFAQIRLTKKTLTKQLFFISLADLLFYSVLLFILPLSFSTIAQVPRYIDYIFLTLFLLSIDELLYNYQILHHKNAGWILLPILFNFTFHFGYILNLWG